VDTNTKKLAAASVVSLAVGIAIGLALGGGRGEPAPPTRDQMMAFIEGMSGDEMVKLKQALTDRWGVKAGPGQGQAGPAR
jgi:hypothetical protein